MPSTPPIVLDLENEVADRIGLLLDAAGLFARAADGTIPLIRAGLRIGAKAVSLTLANAMVIADADVALLSSFAIERVMDEAEWHSLKIALAGWWRVTQHDQKAVSSAVVASGWRLDQKRAVKDRVAQLEAICREPYREPVDPASVVDGRGCPVPPTGSPPQPAYDRYAPGYYPYGTGGPYGYGYGVGPYWGYYP